MEKIAKRIGRRPSAALKLPFLKEVSQNCVVFVLTLSISKDEETSQNLFVLDWLAFTCSGRLAGFLRFGAVRIHFFEEVSRNFVVSDRQIVR